MQTDKLTSFVQRIERMEEEKVALSEDLKEIYLEAKSFGFDTKIIKKLIAVRKLDADKRSEEEELLRIYEAAVKG